MDDWFIHSFIYTLEKNRTKKRTEQNSIEQNQKRTEPKSMNWTERNLTRVLVMKEVVKCGQWKWWKEEERRETKKERERRETEKREKAVNASNLYHQKCHPVQRKPLQSVLDMFFLENCSVLLRLLVHRSISIRIVLVPCSSSTSNEDDRKKEEREERNVEIFLFGY